MEDCQFDRPKPVLQVYRKRRKIAELMFDEVWGIVWSRGSVRDRSVIETKLAVLNANVQGWNHAQSDNGR